MSGGSYNAEKLGLAQLRIVQRQMQRPSQAPHSDWQSLLQFLDEQFLVAREGGFVGWMIEVLLLQAMAMQAAGDATQAIAFLERALALGEPEGYVHTIVEKGQPVTRLLYQAAQRGIAPEYVGKLLAASETETKDPEKKTTTKRSTPVSQPAPLIEPLNKRELQVLHLIAEGLANKEIAQKLFLSPNTVRIHTSNIYGKLNVHNRTRAVVQAQNLGIL